MKEAQKPSEKEAKKIYEIEKTMALTVFKKYYPDAIIDFKEEADTPLEEAIEDVLKEEAEAKEAQDKLDAIAAKEAEEKAAKIAELQKQIAALDKS